jgi:NAD(P)H-dependent FMN reductase
MTIQRAVVLVGSAKPAGTSTSEARARELCARLAARGVVTTVRFVGRSPQSHAERKLVAALADADLFVLATPLYVDSLPYLVTRALEHVARSPLPRKTPCRFVAMINCGFPEAEQCRTALDIARAFARRAGLEWAGGLALSQGGAIDGRPLEELGGLAKRLRAALDTAAAELAEGRPVPAAAVEQVAHRLMPTRMYTFMGNLGWRRRATRNGVGAALDARPFEVSARG